MSTYASSASQMYLTLETLVQNAVKNSGERKVLIGKMMNALNKTAEEMINLIGLLNLVDSYIIQDNIT
jgi:hypothetical protein